MNCGVLGNCKKPKAGGSNGKSCPSTTLPFHIPKYMQVTVIGGTETVMLLTGDSGKMVLRLLASVIQWRSSG